MTHIAPTGKGPSGAGFALGEYIGVEPQNDFKTWWKSFDAREITASVETLDIEA